MTTDWVTWGLQLVLGALLARVWIQLDKNTDAITTLRVLIPTNYETKDDHRKDFEVAAADRSEMKKSIHDIRDRQQATDLRVEELRVIVEQSQ